MEKRIEAGRETALVIDEVERQKWESLGVIGEHAQDEVFRAMARAVANLQCWETGDQVPASGLSSRGKARRPKHK